MNAEKMYDFIKKYELDNHKLTKLQMVACILEQFPTISKKEIEPMYFILRYLWLNDVYGLNVETLTADLRLYGNTKNKSIAELIKTDVKEIHEYSNHRHMGTEEY